MPKTSWNRSPASGIIRTTFLQHNSIKTGLGLNPEVSEDRKDATIKGL